VNRMRWVGGGVLAACVGGGALLSAHAPSGAIFTTLADGSEVNVNQYQAKEDVYLDGGPGIGAPATAAGLDDGTYVFQVTDPSGRTLLSSDPAACRQFTVSGGVITGVVDTSCEHLTGTDEDHDATTVQLFPYDDTPNPGVVYKVWVVTVEDYLAGCAELGVSNGLAVVDCGRAAGNFHGFIPRHTKTDNFKVRNVPIREIDAIFIDPVTGQNKEGVSITWIDPLGASNKKSSYYVSFWDIVEAHVEAIEDGNHGIVLEDQPNCTIGDVYVGPWSQEVYVGSGPRTVTIPIRGHQKEVSEFVKVYCR
jgi:hypothetical protein